MNQQALNYLVIQKPEFGLQSPFSDDIWKITEWDIYKNASSKNKDVFLYRTSVWKNNYDFSKCESIVSREECKYYIYYLIEVKKINIGTLGDYADRLKLLFKYINSRNINSVIDIDSDDFKQYIIDTGHKTAIDDGKIIKNSGEVEYKRKNKIITFLDSLKKIINEYYTKDEPLFKKDIWKYKATSGKASHVYIKFNNIEHISFKDTAKKYAYLLLQKDAARTVQGIIHNLSFFFDWLYQYDQNIKYMKDVDRDIIEEFMFYLRTESGFSKVKRNIIILTLHNYIEYGLMNNWNNFTDRQLITRNDYNFKGSSEVEVFSDTEIKKIYSIIKELDSTYAEVLLLQLCVGSRISELISMTHDMISYDGEQYWLNLYMYKTKKTNKTPIDESIAKIILKRIAKTKKAFPDCKYVFANNDGTYYITYTSFVRKIKKIIIEKQIKGDDGNLLVFKSHKLRATKATKLLSSGVSAEETANTLGHKNLDSLSHYVTVTNDLLWEKIQPLLLKETILINSIGQVDDNTLEDYMAVQPLCNGFCCRNPKLGLCEKANACLNCQLFIPSSDYLINYKNQLLEIDAVIALAKKSGYDHLLEKNLQTKESLERIIRRLEEKQDEQKSKY